MRRWLRHPLLQFVVAGSLLFAAGRWRSRPAAVMREPIVISAARVAALESEYVQRWGRRPSAAELDATVQQAIEDEVLYREARLLRLDAGDSGVRARLVQKMRAVSSDPSLDDEALRASAVALGLDDDLVIRRILREKVRVLLQRGPRDEPPTDSELLAYLEQHRDRFLRPALVSFQHVFLSPTAHGRKLERDAAALLRTLRSRPLSPGDIARLSDPFALGLSFHAVDRAKIARFLGDDVASAVERLPVGTWSDAIRSPFGVHLVRVEERIPERMPSLEAVRQQIQRAVLQARAARRLRDGLDHLRALYLVRVELPTGSALAASRGTR